MSPLYALLLISAIVVAIDLKPYDQSAASFFDEVDTNDDGIARLPEIDSYFRVLDTNKDLKLDAKEFKTYIDSKHSKISGYDAVVYKYFDRNHDGILDVNDLEMLFEDADANKDAVITRPEFVTHYSLVLEELEKAINALSWKQA